MISHATRVTNLPMPNYRRKFTPLFALLLAMALTSSGLKFFTGKANAQALDSRYDSTPTAEFHFARLVYSNSPYSRRGRRPAWATDYPDAEYHLMHGIKRMTNIDIELVGNFGEGGRLISLEDDQIFNYPWLYAAEVGQWHLSTNETTRLREYLDRGGFLIVDDFWGIYEWQIFTESMERVYPDRPIVEISENDPVMGIFFEVDKNTQIPGRNGVRSGSVPHWRGIFDDENRLIVAINFNMDMGDAWEHARDPGYPAEMTAAAYRFAVNYIIYAMTH